MLIECEDLVNFLQGMICMYGFDRKQAILFFLKNKHSDGKATAQNFFSRLGDGFYNPSLSATENPSLIPSLIATNF